MEYFYKNVKIKVRPTYGGFSYEFTYRRKTYFDYTGAILKHHAMQNAQRKIDELKDKSSRTCKCKLPGFDVSNQYICPTCGKKHRPV